jgi:TonB family protein
MARCRTVISLIALGVFASGASAQQQEDSPEPPTVLGAPPINAESVASGKVKAKALFAPKPNYPQYARDHHWTGVGLYVMHVDTKTGLVKSVEVTQTAGHKILDDAVVSAFSRWKFEPGKVAPIVKSPVTFTVSGDSAPTFAPKPEYPDEARQRHMGGVGFYQISVDQKTGLVASVQIVRGAGHPLFNNAAIAALRQWRFKPGTVEKVTRAVIFDSASGTVLFN